MTIVVSTHYTFSEALLGAAEMILGPQSGVYALTFMPDEGTDALTQRMELVIRESESDVLVLTDIPGGTPANVATALSAKYKTSIVTGVNLPMLLEVLLQKDRAPVGDLVALAQTAGKNGVTEVLLKRPNY